MSGWAAIALTVAGLMVVALFVLVFDVYRGDVGGRRTMSRARRLLIVATDPGTEAGANRWITEQRRERPELQCFVLADHEGPDLVMAIEEAIERNRPDAVVVARHADDPHSQLAGIYGELKEHLGLPVDAIYVGEEQGQ